MIVAWSSSSSSVVTTTRSWSARRTCSMMRSAGLPLAVLVSISMSASLGTLRASLAAIALPSACSDRFEVVGTVQRSLQPGGFGYCAEHREGGGVSGSEVADAPGCCGVVPVREWAEQDAAESVHGACFLLEDRILSRGYSPVDSCCRDQRPCRCQVDAVAPATAYWPVHVPVRIGDHHNWAGGLMQHRVGYRAQDCRGDGAASAGSDDEQVCGCGVLDQGVGWLGVVERSRHSWRGCR